MQVRVADQDARVPSRPHFLRNPWTVGWLILLIAVPPSVSVLTPTFRSVGVGTLVAVFLALLAGQVRNREAVQKH